MNCQLINEGLVEEQSLEKGNNRYGYSPVVEEIDDLLKISEQNDRDEVKEKPQKPQNSTQFCGFLHTTSVPQSQQQSNMQVKEQQQESSNQISAVAAAIYPYSLKAEMNTKGLVLVTCHVYNSDMDKARDDCVRLFTETVADLKVRGIKVIEAQ